MHALRGKEHVEYDNPYDVGMTGFIGFASGYAAMKECDALLMLGTDFPTGNSIPRACRWRRSTCGRRPWAIAARCSSGWWAMSRRRWRHCCRGWPRRTTAGSWTSHRALPEGAPGAGRAGRERSHGEIIHPQYVNRLVSELAAEDAIFTCDVGTPTVWAARYLKMNGRRRLLGSFNHGSMANAMLQAIGAQAACPGRQVVSLSGDGGFTMMMGDFITLSQSACR